MNDTELRKMKHLERLANLAALAFGFIQGKEVDFCEKNGLLKEYYDGEKWESLFEKEWSK